jgi:uncharacterized protein YjdB
MPQLAVNTTAQLTATATFADNTTSDITQSATWTSTHPELATVSSTGVISGVAPGSSEVTAAYGGQMGTVTVTVSVAHVVSIAVSPTNPSLAAGSTQQMTAMGTFSDNSVQDITTQVAWTSATPLVATVGANSGLVTGVSAGTSVVTATLGAVSGNTTVTVTPAVLVTIDVEPTAPSIAVGATQQFTATGVYSDLSTHDISAMVTWTSGTPATATINASGLATGVANGTTTITATLGAVNGTALLTVTTAALVSIAVTPVAPSIAKGTTQQFTAMGTYTDLTTHDLTTQVTWSSSLVATATISNAAGSRGLATAAAVGATTITATLGTISGTAALTVTPATLVSIAVTPTNPSIPLGLTKQLTATGTYTDASTQDLTALVTWNSGTAATATVSNAPGSQGLATSVATGTTVITATQGTTSGTTTLTVTAAALTSIQVTPTNPSVALGNDQQFTAMGVYTDGSHTDLTATATWASGTTAVASISNAAGSQGLAHPVATGTSLISATSGAISGSTTLTVTPAALVSIAVTPTNPAIPVLQTQQLTATGTYSDGTHADITTTVTWTSSNPLVASISNAAGSKGQVTGLLPGTAVMTATLGAISGTTTVTITNAVLVSIEVDPADPTIFAGGTQQFTAMGVYSDGSMNDLTTSVTWTSSATAVATISNAAGTHGLATGIDAGTATITATQGATSGSTVVTVAAVDLVSIAVSPLDASIAASSTLQYTATGTYSDGSTNDITGIVTWTTADPATATISNAPGSVGLATGVLAGTTTVTATSGAISGSTSLTVTPVALVSIAVTPANPSVAKGLTQQFTATGTYSDGSTQDVTVQATWASSAVATATVSNAAGTNGVATTVAVGTTTISATLDTITGSTTLTVTAAAVASIAVTPLAATVGPGATQQFVATATLTDGSTQVITTTAGTVWASGTAAVASVSNAAGTIGLATGLTPGTSTITATSNGVSGAATLTVSPLSATIVPIDGYTGIRTTTPLTVTFNGVVAQATVTVQTTTGACSGSVQLSTDNFATCLALGAPAFDATSKVVTITPAATLTALTTYKVKVTTDVATAAGAALSADLAQASGWQTATDGTCASALVISQVYGAGGNGGATYNHDFVELHNAGAGDINLNGLSLAYASSAGMSWTTMTALPNVTIHAGTYYLIQLAGGSVGIALPTPDFIPAANISMAAGAGKVALVEGTQTLTGLCPVQYTLDFVGYGSGTNCFEGTAPTGTINATTSAIRGNAGCTDANANNTDFTVAPVAPRNQTTAADTCSCPAPQGSLAEVDYCNLQSPATLDATAGSTTDAVYERVYEANDTEAAGQGAGITASVGYGAAASDPTTTAWTWVNASYNVDVGNNDEYQATFTAPATAGTYSYTSRFTRDGVNWTYCDLDGAGSNTGLSFDYTMVGVLTVN